MERIGLTGTRSKYAALAGMGKAGLRFVSGKRARQGGGFAPTFRAVSKAAKASADDLPFEEALKKLETVVEAMESDELPLEQLLTRFEEGTRLVEVCQARLAEAELKIQKLEQNLAGEMIARPLALGGPASVAA